MSTKKAFSNLIKIFEKVEKAAFYLSMLAVGLLLFSVSGDVLSKILLGSSIKGAFEISEILFIFIVYLSISYLQSLKEHVALEIATTWLPEKIQKGLDTFGILLGIFIMGIVAWQTSLVALDSIKRSEISMAIINIPLWPGKLVVFLGFGLLFVRLTLDACRSIKQLLES